MRNVGRIGEVTDGGSGMVPGGEFRRAAGVVAVVRCIHGAFVWTHVIEECFMDVCSLRVLHGCM